MREQVRENRPAPQPVTSDTVDEVMDGAVGNPDRVAVENGLRLLFRTFGYELLEPPRVLWANGVAVVPSPEDAAPEDTVPDDRSTDSANAGTHCTVRYAPIGTRRWRR